MEKGNTLEVIKQCFRKALPDEDARSKISPLNFIAALVFCYLGDSKNFSLEAIRRNMEAQLEEKICRSAFWERLSRKRLKALLKILISKLMIKLADNFFLGQDILLALGVTGIRLIDSTSITLWDGSGQSFPGTRTHAGIKWHACFDLLSGVMTWYELTSTSIHDRKCFPDVNSLRGSLIIFDLGYWDYGLFFAIDKINGFFLSRIKSNAAITIKNVIKGISPSHIGKKLSSLKFKRRSKLIVELIGGVLYKSEVKNFRVIGFWNPTGKTYHWYITNLKVPAKLIYTLYRIRWQVELIFKSCKNSLNSNQITSNEPNIIECLLLSSIVANLTTNAILNIGVAQLGEEKKQAVSFQRIAKLAVILANDFLYFLINSGKKYLEILIKKIKFLSMEIFDPNFRKRLTTLQNLEKLTKNKFKKNKLKIIKSNLQKKSSLNVHKGKFQYHNRDPLYKKCA